MIHVSIYVMLMVVTVFFHVFPKMAMSENDGTLMNIKIDSSHRFIHGCSSPQDTVQ